MVLKISTSDLRPAQAIRARVPAAVAEVAEPEHLATGREVMVLETLTETQREAGLRRGIHKWSGYYWENDPTARGWEQAPPRTRCPAPSRAGPRRRPAASAAARPGCLAMGGKLILTRPCMCH
jgi:hypothetical protein